MAFSTSAVGRLTCSPGLGYPACSDTDEIEEASASLGFEKTLSVKFKLDRRDCVLAKETMELERETREARDSCVSRISCAS